MFSHLHSSRDTNDVINEMKAGAKKKKKKRNATGLWGGGGGVGGVLHFL